MKSYAVFIVLFVAAASAQQSCYNEVDHACSELSNKPKLGSSIPSCNATYGHINIVLKHLIRFANSHISQSFDYLLMATHYGNYQKNRPGFEKLFRGLSDEKWEDAFKLIKHITKRGGAMNFGTLTDINTAGSGNKVFELYEIQSVSKALDMEKQLALDAFEVHREASGRSEGRHDPEIASYVEQQFMHEQAETVRKLAGYVTDLNSTLSGPDASLSLYLFDEYLQSQ